MPGIFIGLAAGLVDCSARSSYDVDDIQSPGSSGGAGGTGGVAGSSGAGGITDSGSAAERHGAVYLTGDAKMSLTDLLAGIWLFGRFGDINHFSWIRFSPIETNDASGRGYGIVDILSSTDAIARNGSYWGCAGRGRWFVDALPNTFDIELPPTCADAGNATYTVLSYGGVPIFPSESTSHIEMMDLRWSVPIEAFLFPDNQCDAAMIMCTPAK
jgi:hypothetical protein